MQGDHEGGHFLCTAFSILFVFQKVSLLHIPGWPPTSVFLHLPGIGISGVYHYFWLKDAHFEQGHLLSLGSW